MKEDDIAILFEKIAKHFEDVNDSTKIMFSMLVSVALKFRDDLVELGADPLTVGETKEALGIFMEIIKTHKMPLELEGRKKLLVVKWLEALKVRVRH